jgi:hypothetical protein
MRAGQIVSMASNGVNMQSAGLGPVKLLPRPGVSVWLPDNPSCNGSPESPVAS